MRIRLKVELLYASMERFLQPTNLATHKDPVYSGSGKWHLYMDLSNRVIACFLNLLKHLGKLHLIQKCCLKSLN